jgi:hypothetical protein
MITLTPAQQDSINHYQRMGITFSFTEEGIILIKQERLINGYILNNKQLYAKARSIFPEGRIKPLVYSFQANDVTLEWIEAKMDEFGLNRKDLVKQLAFNKDWLSLIFAKKEPLTPVIKAAFYYYFLVYELNRDVRAAINTQ